MLKAQDTIIKGIHTDLHMRRLAIRPGKTASPVRRATIQGKKYRAYGRRDIDKIAELGHLSADQKLAMKAVSAVLPFRVNNYVVEELIDWDRVPDDPIYQLTFPQPGMLGAGRPRSDDRPRAREAPEDECSARRARSSAA